MEYYETLTMNQLVKLFLHFAHQFGEARGPNHYQNDFYRTQLLDIIKVVVGRNTHVAEAMQMVYQGVGYLKTNLGD